MGIDVLETIRGEDRHVIGLLSKAFPKIELGKFAGYTIRIRTEKYATGRWPSIEELRKTYEPYFIRSREMPFWTAGVPLAGQLLAAHKPE